MSPSKKEHLLGFSPSNSIASLLLISFFFHLLTTMSKFCGFSILGLPKGFPLLVPFFNAISIPSLCDKQSGKDFNRENYITLKHILRENDLLVIKSI